MAGCRNLPGNLLLPAQFTFFALLPCFRTGCRFQHFFPAKLMGIWIDLNILCFYMALIILAGILLLACLRAGSRIYYNTFIPLMANGGNLFRADGFSAY
jgi:hypothetical protein